ncbi:MAG: putative aminohydrolase SsnA [Ardenticatenales bacterium]|nr:putative aminohydrolase SsnA [Ardenticatenales bacterium]
MLILTHLRIAPDPADFDATILDDHAIVVEGDEIVEIVPSAEAARRFPSAERVDGRGKLALPGAICAHTHFYGAYARGLAIPGPAPADFPQILRRLWWTLDRALTRESVRASAEVMLLDAIRNGCTTLIDHHASPNAVAGSLAVIGEAVLESGLRGCLCYEVSDRDGAAVAAQGIAENVRWLERCHAAPNPRLAATFGLHAAMTLSDETLDAARAAAHGLPFDVGFHIHAAEGPADQRHSHEHYGLPVIERLHQRGILGPRTIVAHAIDISDRERALLAESGSWVSHQPRSNMNNAVGVADVTALLADPVLGNRTCLGNDGFSFDMFAEMKTAYLLHKVATNDPRSLPGGDVMRMAYANNARLAALFFDKPVGVLKVGAYADIMLTDYRPFTPLHSGNLPWHLLFGMSGSNVTDTIAGGRLVMRDRNVMSMDEATVVANARALADEVWRHFAALSGDA